LRWSGAIALMLALAWTISVPKPDILISADGRNVAVRGNDGRLHLMRSGKDAFLTKEWLAADADARNAADASLADGVSCDGMGCVTQTASRALVALALRPEALADDCARAVLIVTARQPPSPCAAPVIEAERLRRQGALALRKTRDAIFGRGGQARRYRPAVVAGNRRRERSRLNHCRTARGGSACRGCNAVGSRPSGRRLNGAHSRFGEEEPSGSSNAPR
jgi:competence protein ComEC